MAESKCLRFGTPANVRECLGPVAAVAAVVLFPFEPNLLAHFGLVTTDASLTCFVFGTIYFLWKTCRKPTLSNSAGFIGFFVLAILTKFSALLLGHPLLGEDMHIHAVPLPDQFIHWTAFEPG